MTTADYRMALDAAVREYEALTRQRSELDGRIAQLAQTIGNLSKLCGLVPTVPWGLTDACRMVLKAAGHPLTAIEVRAQLEAMGFDLTRYSNELAAIHTILKRLSDSREVRFEPRAWDKPGYVWHSHGHASPPLPVRAVVITKGEAAAIRRAGKHGSGAKPGSEKKR
jgi:hypothetical protein